ncbi:MAG: FAD-dependent oxidoreductase, partial [Ktedonobacterales bacterium]
MAVQHERTQRQVGTPQEAAARFRQPAHAQYDVLIIGAGSAGLSAAGSAVALGARTALVDREKFGGECLYTGCVPSKALLHVARLAAQVRNAAELGLNAQLAPVDLGAVADHVQRIIREVYVESDAPENYAALGVEPLLGDVRFISPTAVTINGQQVTAKRYLLCTGSRPTVPPTPGLAEAGYLTNETVFAQRRLPRSLIVIGGGPIGCELGQA